MRDVRVLVVFSVIEVNCGLKECLGQVLPRPLKRVSESE